LEPLTLQLIAHGVNARRIETSELVHHAPRLLDSPSLVIAVSQSGQSAEIVKFLERHGGRKFPLIGVTNTAASPLAGAADTVLLTHAGSEFSVSCKTYVATLAALDLMGAVLTRDDPGPHRTQLEETASAMDQYLAHWHAYVADLQERLKEIEQMVLVGRGPSLAAVGTGALIIREAARFPCQELSSAAFRHGPLEMISPKLFVLVFRGIPPTIEHNERLVADIRVLGGNADLVRESLHTSAFALPPVTSAMLPLLEILPPEMISLALARLRGHVPGHFERGSKITVTE
jgi:glucosamine--fructose-6-phosphate aminotransferase (isomerizing)